MNKLFTKIAALALGATMAVGVGVAVASNSKAAEPVNAADGSVTWSGGSYSNSTITWTSTYLTAKQEKNTGQTAPNSSYVSAPRWYSGNKVTFTPNNGCTITSMTITATSDSYATALRNSTWSSGTAGGSGTSVTWTGSANSAFTVVLGGQSRLGGTGISFTYSGGGDTPTLSSIAVKTAPTKTSYEEGEYFDPTGLVITKTMSDSSISDVSYASESSSFTFTPNTSTALTTSDTSVTIGYGGKSTTQAITVSTVTPLISDGNYYISFSYNSTQYYANDASSVNSYGAPLLVGASSTTKGVYTISRISGNRYTIQLGTDYLIVGKGENNGIKFSSTLNDQAKWDVTSNGTGFNFKNVSFNTRYLSNYQSTDVRCYTSTCKVTLEEATIAATINGNSSVDVNVQWSPTSITEDVGGATVTGATFAFAVSDGAHLSASNTSTGAFTADSAGTVTVSATKSGYTIASKTVTVNSADPYINLTLTSGATAFTGQTVTITAEYGNGVAGLSWTVQSGTVSGATSSNTGYSATIGGSSGTLTIRATDTGGATYAEVSVTVTKVTLTLNKNSTTIQQGKSETLTATHNASAVGGVTWSSNNAKVTVGASTGVVTVAADAVKDSTATITATSAVDSTVTATCTVTVAERPSEVEITYSSFSANLPASGYATVAWSADGVEGQINAIKNTDSVIQFKANESFVYNTLAISGYITSITLEKQNGKNYSQLTAFVADSDGGAITSKPASGGTDNSTDWTWTFDANDHYCYFRIDATSANAKYISSITIGYQKVQSVDPTGIVLDDSSAISMDTYGYGRRRLSATVQPFNANDKTVTWGTSNSSVVTVSNGVLTAVGLGTTTVYATTSNYVSDVQTPDLKASVSVTVTEALYLKATFVPTGTSTVTQADDYLADGSVTLSSNGSWNSDKSALQISAGKSATFTISGYEGMKISGIDLIMSSNGNAGTGALTVTAGSTDIVEIESAPFSDGSWNGAYDAFPCDIHKLSTEYVVEDGEDIEFSFSATVNSLYIHSVSVRYLDYSLEKWCGKFLEEITCNGTGAITDDSKWDDLGVEFLDLDDDLQAIAATATANKDSSSVIERAMARYDLIIRKYGTTAHDDFIGRFGEGKINGTLGSPKLILNNVMGNTNTVVIIVVVSIISVTCIGGYFFLRKRKEN